MNPLQQFLNDRPACTLKGISKESKYTYDYLVKIKDGRQPYTKGVAENLEPIFRRYGYEV